MPLIYTSRVPSLMPFTGRALLTFNHFFGNNIFCRISLQALITHSKCLGDADQVKKTNTLFIKDGFFIDSAQKVLISSTGKQKKKELIRGNINKGIGRPFVILFLVVFILATTNLYGQVSIRWEKYYGQELYYNYEYSYDPLRKTIPTLDGGYLFGSYSMSILPGGAYYWIVKTDANGSKQWDKRFGGNGNDELTTMIQTMDGGYLLGGNSTSDVGADKSQANRGELDYWIVKTDANGNKQWDKTFGGTGDDEIITMLQTTDGGYLLGGKSDSPISGEKTGNSKGGKDFWLVKITAKGKKQWDKTFGGNSEDYLSTMIQTQDSGYLLAGGSASSMGGDKTEKPRGDGYYDYWVVKITSTGTKVWDKTLGGEFGEDLRSVVQNADGSYLLAGNSSSPISGDKTEFCVTCYVHEGDEEETPYRPGDQIFTHYWFVTIDSTGTKLWDKVIRYNDTYGAYYYGGQHTVLSKVIPVSNGDFIIGGTEGIMVAQRDGYGSIIRIDKNGIIKWKANLWYTTRGIQFIPLIDLFQAADGGYVVGRYDENVALGYTIIKTSPDTAADIAVKSFTLINADTDQDIQTILSGDTIDLAALPTHHLNIRANTLPTIVGRVVFNLNGKLITENFIPYAIGGDAHPNNGDYKAWKLPLGTHTLQATPYSTKYNGGTAGSSLTIQFTVVEKPKVESFSLINTDNSQVIMELTDGSVVDLSQLPTSHLNIRANTKPAKTGIVVFDFNSKIVVENTPPYALGGDSHIIFPITYKPLDPPLTAGTYNLKATPYHATKGSGLHGTSLAIKFFVEDHSSTARIDFSNRLSSTSNNIVIFPNPATDIINIGLKVGSEQKADIEIINSKGQIMERHSTTLDVVKTSSININQLPKGMYLVRIEQKGIFSTIKFNKQ
jgi:hypothetical protein